MGQSHFEYAACGTAPGLAPGTDRTAKNISFLMAQNAFSPPVYIEGSHVAPLGGVPPQAVALAKMNLKPIEKT